MATTPTSKALQQLDDAIERAATGERVRVRRRWKQVVIVPVEDLKLIRAIEDYLDKSAVETSRAEIRKGKKAIPLEEVKRRWLK